MDARWLSHYPPGVPAEISANQPPHLGALFETACQQFSSQPAFTHLTRTLSFSEFAALSEQLAAFLQHRGLHAKQRIAIMLPNCLQYPVTLFAAFKLGLTVVNVNPLYTERECQHQLEDADVSAIVVLKQYASIVEAVLNSQKINIFCVIITELADLLSWGQRTIFNCLIRTYKIKVKAYQLKQALSFRFALQQGKKYRLKSVSIQVDDLAFLQYTGGTTGVSKGAMLSHGNLLANVAQVRLWIQGTVTPGKEVILTALPLYHIFALMANCLTFFSLGAHNVLVSDPRDLKHLIKIMKKHPCTCMTGVNSLFKALLEHSEFDAACHQKLQLALAGGMALEARVAQLWQKRVGIPLLEAYGLTETSPAVTLNPLQHAHFNGSVGLPIPSTQISLRDEAAKEIKPGESGELYVKGPQVMQGYWRKATETRLVLSDSGWLATGDIARMDEQGFLYLLERKKEMICVSGFNVYPNEIEALMNLHKDVQESAAIGVEDPHSGERVKLFVVKKNPKLDKSTLFAYCKANLTNYKRPKLIEFIDELPKSNVGKILRKDLR